MSVYKFGKSVKKENFIERVVTKNNELLIQSTSTTINIAMLLGYIVDKPIELAYVLLELQHLPINNTKALYWKDKKLTLVVGNINGPISRKPNDVVVNDDMAIPFELASLKLYYDYK